MIERLQLIATHLLPFRVVMVLVAVLSFAVLVLSLLDNPWLADDALLIPAVLCFTWSATLLSFSGLFANMPHKPGAGSGWRARLSYRLRHAVLWLLGLTMVALCGVLFVLTYQLLRVGAVG